MKYVKLFVLLVILGLTSGCETLTKVGAKALGAASDDGISLDAQIGDRQTEVQTDLGNTKAVRDIKAQGNSQVQVTNERAEAKVEQAGTVKVQNIPPWVFLIAIIGWLVPTPQYICKSIYNYFKKDKV